MDLMILTLLGGVLALDGTSVGQIMISRPLVAGVLTGWIVGDPVLGLLLGGILEVFSIPAFPVGGADFPEGGPPAVVAVATASLVPEAGGLALGALLGLLWSRLGALSVKGLRRFNGRYVPDPLRAPVTHAGIVRVHLLGIGLDFLRGGLLAGVGLILGRLAVGAAAAAWPLDRSETLGILALGASLPAGAFVKSLGGWRKRGFLLGLGIVVFLAGSLAL